MASMFDFTNQGTKNNSFWGNNNSASSGSSVYGSFNPTNAIANTQLPNAASTNFWADSPAIQDNFASRNNGTLFGSSNTPGQSSWWDKIVGSKDNPGVGQLGLGLASGIGNFWLGSKQLSLGKDQLRTSKQQFADQFNMQKNLIDLDLKNESENRHRSRPDLYPTATSYYDSHNFNKE